MATGRFHGKVAIVTGGCKGIGRACADIFVENGGKVAVIDIDDEVGRTFQDVTGPGEMFYIRCNMRKEDEIKAAIEKTITKFKRIDCLVNNAAWHPGSGQIDDYSGTDLANLLQLNVVGYYLASKFTLPHLRKTKGNIVNISSIAGSLGERDSVTYCCTKGAVSALSRALAIDEAVNEVRVNAISPHTTDTPLVATVTETLSDEYKKRLNDFSWIRRLCDPREVGRLCFFLASDATYMTGQDVRCSGGAEIGDGLKYF